MDPTSILLGALVGFFAGQASKYLERREDRRQAINRALSDLLEIRHRFRGTTYIVGRITRELKLPYGHYDEILAAVPEGILWDPAISARYSDSVDTISRYSPLLSYVLRSKDMAGALGSGRLIKFGDSRETYEVAVMAYEAISNSLLPELDASIELLSSMADRKIRKNTRQLLRMLEDHPPEAEAVVDKLINSVNRAAGG